MIRLVHYFSEFERLGGVHTLLKKHERKDRDYGLDSCFIIGWERQTRPQPEPRVYFLGIDLRSNIRLHRHRFRVASELTRPDFAVYHTPATLEYLADLDGAKRRIVILHTHPPKLRESMQMYLGLIDGVLSVSQPLHEEFLKNHPEWPAERAAYLPLPVEPALPMAAARHGRSPDQFVIGYSGRLIHWMKRADRLAPFARALKRLGLDARLEIAGGGNLESSLRKECKSAGNTRFLGTLSGSDYWSAIAGWDLMLNCSDQEAGTTALLEGMAVGCLPLCPDIPCQGRIAAATVEPGLVYPAGDIEGAAKRLIWFRSLPPSRRAQLELRAREIVRDHTPNHYFEVFSLFVQMIRAMPRRSQDLVPVRMRGLDDLSFAWQFRLLRFKQTYERLWRMIGGLRRQKLLNQ